MATEPKPWSDEWIRALADELWNPGEGYESACCGFARAVARKAMEEAAQLADVHAKKRRHPSLDGELEALRVRDAILVRAKEIADETDDDRP